LKKSIIDNLDLEHEFFQIVLIDSFSKKQQFRVHAAHLGTHFFHFSFYKVYQRYSGLSLNSPILK